MNAQGVKLVINQPRLTFTQHMLCNMALANGTGWGDDPFYHGGSFWEQSMQGVLARAASIPDVKYILCLDFDSVFTPEDAWSLYRILEANPDIDGVFPIQMSRHNDRPLCYLPQNDYTSPFTEQGCGHFGLAMFKADIFRNNRIPMPWFWGMPNAKGEWEDPGKLDPDMWFWKIGAEKGLKFVQANQVVIGHMELCVKWPHPEAGFSYQPVRHYQENGKPKNVGVNWEKYKGLALSYWAKICGKKKIKLVERNGTLLAVEDTNEEGKEVREEGRQEVVGQTCEEVISGA